MTFGWLVGGEVLHAGVDGKAIGWKIVAEPDPPLSFYLLAYNGKTYLGAGWDDSELYTSTDGKKWRKQSEDLQVNLVGGGTAEIGPEGLIAHNGTFWLTGRFTADDATTVVMSSKDGHTWSSYPLPDGDPDSGERGFDIAAHGRTIIVPLRSGAILRSHNLGATWSLTSVDPILVDYAAGDHYDEWVGVDTGETSPIFPIVPTLDPADGSITITTVEDPDPAFPATPRRAWSAVWRTNWGLGDPDPFISPTGEFEIAFTVETSIDMWLWLGDLSTSGGGIFTGVPDGWDGTNPWLCTAGEPLDISYSFLRESGEGKLPGAFTVNRSTDNSTEDGTEETMPGGETITISGYTVKQYAGVEAYNGGGDLLDGHAGFVRNNKWVVVRSFGSQNIPAVARSVDDGATWQLELSPFDFQLQVSQDDDGWHSDPSTTERGFLKQLVYADHRLFSFGGRYDDSTHSCYWTQNGVDWTAVASPFDGYSEGIHIAAIAADGSLLALGYLSEEIPDASARSHDGGMTWQLSGRVGDTRLLAAVWGPISDVPLRQHPRDDPLGGSPRQNKSTTSRQSSPRQGWTNTYR
jgi:hypothetical protein